MPYAFIGYSCSLEELRSVLELLKSGKEEDPSHLRDMLRFALEVEAKVYWCANKRINSNGEVCLPHDISGLGHPHVFFYIDPPQLDHALKKIEEFTPNMNCKEVDVGLITWMEKYLIQVIE